MSAVAADGGFAVLAQRGADGAAHPVVCEDGGWGGGWAVWAFIWFIIIVAIVFFLIVAFGGDWLGEFSSSDESGRRGSRDRCHNNWWGRALLWAVVVALVILILFWLLACLGGGRRHAAC